MVELLFQVLEYSSLIFLSLLLIGVALLSIAYLLDITWNLIRAMTDSKRGFEYYFSEDGPEN